MPGCITIAQMDIEGPYCISVITVHINGLVDLLVESAP